MDTIQKHKEMVLRLAKPGEAILKSLTPWDCDLIHMGGCLMGEAAELYGSINNDWKELLEELGDFAFYLVKCETIFGLSPFSCPRRSGDYEAGADSAVKLMKLAGDFWDVVKRIVVYRKDPNAADSKYEGKTLNQVARELLEKMEVLLLQIAWIEGCVLEDVLEANWTKLADVDKGRYASGSYSDQQAQDRRDKAS